MREARCRGCKAPIIFAVTEQGRTIPLDVRAPTYRVKQEDDGTLPGTLRAQRTRGVLVSHFATCPKASAFSRRGMA